MLPIELIKEMSIFNGGMMKKKVKAKTMAIKRKKNEPVSVSTGVDQDVIGLLTVLVQKLTSFEAKIDMVLSRIPVTASVSAVVPKPQLPMTSAPVITSSKPIKENRPMFKAVCADCTKDCEVPFKPRTDRQVYCKECFSKRKNNKNISKSSEAEKPKSEIVPTVKALPVVKAKEVKPVKSSKKNSKIIKKVIIKKPGRKK
jgi:CxxC-x17-CxxC domain-containing protein